MSEVRLLGGAGMRVEPYLEFLEREYLADYLPDGGASVRFVVPGGDEVTDRWHAGLAAAAARHGYLHCQVDAATTRVHLMHEFFAAVSRQLDWTALVRQTVRAAYASLGLPAPLPDTLTVDEVADHHDVDRRELQRDVRRALESRLLSEARLLREFRLGLLRLAQAELGTGAVEAAERDAVLAWLTVEPVPLRALRSSLIYTRINRHNARAMLTGLTDWLPSVEVPGLVVDLDVARLAVARRPPAEQRDGFYYSKAATLDAYEVLRQLIDGTDHFRHALIAVTLPPSLLTDDARGLPAYSALHLRVMDEVRDRRRSNPFAALMRLETRMEAVG
jgi:P-loop Domain of unknown function (DUF2791)